MPLIALATITACISVRPVIVAEKTPLEDEILGVFERLNIEPALPAAPQQPTPRMPSTPRRRVLQALLDRAHDAEEIDDLEDRKILVERPSGLIALDETVAQQENEKIPPLRALVTRENASRDVIMKGIIALSPRLSARDLPTVRAFFYHLNTRVHSTAEGGKERGNTTHRSDGKKGDGARRGEGKGGGELEGHGKAFWPPVK